MLKKRQGNLAVEHHTFYSVSPNDQADQDAKRFWNGLERFVNTGDSLEDYGVLRKAWPTFWPVAIETRGRSLAWSDEAHPLFKFYRDILRALWARDPSTSTNGTYVNVLFGMVRPEAQIKKCFPEMKPADPSASFWPEWGVGVVRYIPCNDFQRAIWELFRQSWRGKVCAACRRYFVAEKPAQTYCDTSCSNRVHRSSSLKWWREKGARRRARKGKG